MTDVVHFRNSQLGGFYGCAYDRCHVSRRYVDSCDPFVCWPRRCPEQNNSRFDFKGKSIRGASRKLVRRRHGEWEARTTNVALPMMSWKTKTNFNSIFTVRAKVTISTCGQAPLTRAV